MLLAYLRLLKLHGSTENNEHMQHLRDINKMFQQLSVGLRMLPGPLFLQRVKRGLGQELGLGRQILLNSD